MNYDDKIIEIFCEVDDFCNLFQNEIDKHTLSENTEKKRNRKFSLCQSEIITIVVFFHLKRFRDFKSYYTQHVCLNMKSDFPGVVSYNRFVELMSKAIIPMILFLKMRKLGKCTGISIIDSTPLRACHIKREHSHKTFKNFAAKGQCSIGWFFGFKLHLIINDKGEILDFVITKGNTDDRTPLKEGNILKNIYGKLFGDKGYIGQDLFEQLFIDGIHLVTKLKKNMKNSLMDIKDKLMLRKRALIESVNDELKNVCQIEHTRHRSFNNFVVNLISGLIAYQYLPKKPSIRCQVIDSLRLAITC